MHCVFNISNRGHPLLGKNDNDDVELELMTSRALTYHGTPPRNPITKQSINQGNSRQGDVVCIYTQVQPNSSVALWCVGDWTRACLDLVSVSCLTRACLDLVSV